MGPDGPDGSLGPQGHDDPLGLDDPLGRAAPLGILAALPEELAPLVAESQPRQSACGVPLWDWPRGHGTLALSGVGKVAAATAAMALLQAGVKGICVVGTGGAISPDLSIGDCVHATGAIQADLSTRMGRESRAHAPWVRWWQGHQPGAEGLILSGDRPVMGYWARRKLRKAYAGTLLADMEVAAVGAVCERAGFPFAALKVVTDGAGARSQAQFAAHFQRFAPLPAQSLLMACPKAGSRPGGFPERFSGGSGPISG